MADGPAEKFGRRIKAISVDLKLYVEKRLELMAISVGEGYARWIAESMQKMLGLVLLFGALVFLLIALALYLGALLNSRSIGFVLVSLPLLIVGFLFFKLKPRSLTQKLKVQLEEEFIKIFTIDDDKNKDKLISSNSNELENKTEHNV